MISRYSGASICVCVIVGLLWRSFNVTHGRTRSHLFRANRVGEEKEPFKRMSMWFSSPSVSKSSRKCLTALFSLTPVSEILLPSVSSSITPPVRRVTPTALINRISSQHSLQLLPQTVGPWTAPFPLFLSRSTCFAAEKIIKPKQNKTYATVDKPPILLVEEEEDSWTRKGFSLYKAFFFFLFSSNVSVNVCVFIYYKTSDDFISAANHTLYTVH